MSKSARKKRAEARARRQTSRTVIGIVVAMIVIVLVTVLLLVRDAGQISVAEAAGKRDQGAFILDVRTVEEWEEYHIPDSTLIPLDQLEIRVNEVPRDQEVVVVCRSGNRSRQGRGILENAGFTEVSSMQGGIQRWASEGYPVVTGP
ncbi:MAG: rhodanese-like domain-containing protein [Anaerolineae bacterium]|nr:rhodanese-like domain-containing protein [Anaerolineae bacterium]